MRLWSHTPDHSELNLRRLKATDDVGRVLGGAVRGCDWLGKGGAGRDWLGRGGAGRDWLRRGERRFGVRGQRRS